MKNITIILLLAAFAISANLENDTKIGYVYMDLVLTNMEEAKQMNKVLDKFSAEKTAQLTKNTQFLNNKIQEMMRKQKAGELTDAGRIISENEISDLKASIEKQARANEQELYTKRIELLGPIAKKLEAAMDDVAATMGYKYVLNSSDGTGNSIVVVAPEADDLTQEVMKELGIKYE